MTILFASSNTGKIIELEQLFNGSSFDLHTTRDSDFPALEVEETGETFEENALLKAQAYAKAYNLPTVADDSGLCVSALDDQPGVLSNRWVAGSDHDRNVALLEKMRNQRNKAAFFVTVLCVYIPSTATHYFFRGEVHGTISNTEMGSDGFGYDPVFIPNAHEQTFAQLGNDVKNTLSHRARALQKMFTFLTTKYIPKNIDEQRIHSSTKNS